MNLQSQRLLNSQGVGTELRPTLVELAPAGEVAPVLFGREVSTIWLIRSFEVCKDDDAASDADDRGGHPRADRRREAAPEGGRGLSRASRVDVHAAVSHGRAPRIPLHGREQVVKRERGSRRGETPGRVHHRVPGASGARRLAVRDARRGGAVRSGAEGRRGDGRTDRSSRRVHRVIRG